MAAGLLLPLPHLVDEGVAAEVVAALALLGGDLALHQHLRRDAGVVGAHLPQGVAPLHPPPADQGVHDGVLEGVAHVQAAGDVGRRDHDGVGLALTGGGEAAIGLPALVPAGFDLLGLVGLVHGVTHSGDAPLGEVSNSRARMKNGVKYSASGVWPSGGRQQKARTWRASVWVAREGYIVMLL